jgi:hypothetical protein
MSKTFEFIEEYQNISSSIISKIELLENDQIVMYVTGSNEDNQIYNLHRAWVYPERKYSLDNSGNEIWQ